MLESPQSVNILCLDTELETQNFVSETLEEHGYQVLVCADPLEALSLLLQSTPILILAALELPRMDGYTFGRMLHSHASLADVPIIFFVQEAHKQDPLRLFKAGGVDFIVKPFSSQELVKKVMRHLRPIPAQIPPLLGELQPIAKTRVLSLADYRLWLTEKLNLSPYVAKLIENLGIGQIITLLEQRGVPQLQSVKFLGEFMAWPVLEKIDPTHLHLQTFPLSFIEANGVLPLQSSPQHPLTFALCNPFNLELLDQLNRYPHSQHVLISPAQLEFMLSNRSAEEIESETIKPESLELTEVRPVVDISDLQREMSSRYIPEPTPSPEQPESGLENLDQDSPFIIRLLSRIIENACQMEASDIHIQPAERDILIRYRVDGNLHLMHRLTPPRVLLPLVSRLKIMSSLDIAEHRMPQDGRITYKHFSTRKMAVDLRISVIPSQFGESVVMRIIYKSRSQVSLDHFGFSPKALEIYRQGLKNPYGMILNVGPTGSGKTTTLYAAIHELNQPERKILTIEDPVEYTIPGILQVETQPDIGLTFQRALKAFLRHDPDIILLGEIRDLETARTAIEASLTGHLVLSTMHTNDAASTITRFMEMGIPAFMVSSSLMMICAQRLVRKLCLHCREPYEASGVQKQQMQIDVLKQVLIYKARGCDSCGMTGYHGRMGIHEVLLPSERLRESLAQPGCTAETIRSLAIKNCHMIPLYQDALAKVLAGVTSLEEINTHVLDSEKTF
jgi:type IV pilus assembly protein PilB